MFVLFLVLYFTTLWSIVHIIILWLIVWSVYMTVRVGNHNLNCKIDNKIIWFFSLDSLFFFFGFLSMFLFLVFVSFLFWGTFALVFLWTLCLCQDGWTHTLSAFLFLGMQCGSLCSWWLLFPWGRLESLTIKITISSKFLFFFLRPCLFLFVLGFFVLFLARIPVQNGWLSSRWLTQ